MSIIQSIFAPRAETTTLSRPAQWLIDALGGSKSSAGVTVNAQTAMGLAVYFACIRNISEDIAKLPWDVFKKKKPRGREPLPDHAVSRLIESPNENMTWFTLIETLTQHALGWRAGRAEIVRRGDGSPAALWPLDPNTIRKEVSSDDRVRYVVTTSGRGEVILQQNQVLDIHGLGFDGLTGYAMTWVAREQIGAAIATQNHRSRWFGNGAQPSGILEVPAGFGAPAMENLRKSFEERHEGEENKGKTLMLEMGVTWKSVSVDAEKAQMIEALEWDVEDICRRFRMPPQKVGHLKRAQGWSTVEQFNTDYVVDCLTPWLVRWEKEIKRKLFSARESDHYVKGNFAGLLRGDSAARSAFYRELFNIGVLTQNDILDKEDFEPFDGGDVHYVQGAMIPVDLLRDKLQAEIDKLNEPEPEPAAPAVASPKQLPAPENRLSTLISLANAHEPLLADAFARVLKTEADFVTRAKKKPDADARCRKFYTDHREHVIAAIGQQIDAFLVAATGKPAASLDYHRMWAQSHVDRSLADISDGAEIVSWTDGRRSAEIAKYILMNIIQAVEHERDGSIVVFGAGK